MEKLLSEEQLQGIYGGSDKDEMKELQSPVKLGGVRSTLKDKAHITMFGLNLTSAGVDACVDHAMKLRNDGLQEQAEHMENNVKRQLEVARSSTETEIKRARLG